ncbi:hypothetical protein QBC37DRAFT_464911 [Rhypophila decipiens]|uniref:Uncharacterized protein n=1 Tax=Rhypophila decipiens TaxID=261697 RepID=A0AAN6Y599_9PEZI|nr:hypothetical protein QBC37DRAFT_464911 [Rhypophila decipiens]
MKVYMCPNCGHCAPGSPTSMTKLPNSSSFISPEETKIPSENPKQNTDSAPQSGSYKSQQHINTKPKARNSRIWGRPTSPSTKTPQKKDDDLPLPLQLPLALGTAYLFAHLGALEWACLHWLISWILPFWQWPFPSSFPWSTSRPVTFLAGWADRIWLFPSLNAGQFATFGPFRRAYTVAFYFLFWLMVPMFLVLSVADCYDKRRSAKNNGDKTEEEEKKKKKKAPTPPKPRKERVRTEEFTLKVTFKSSGWLPIGFGYVWDWKQVSLEYVLRLPATWEGYFSLLADDYVEQMDDGPPPADEAKDCVESETVPTFMFVDDSGGVCTYPEDGL